MLEVENSTQSATEYLEGASIVSQQDAPVLTCPNCHREILPGMWPFPCFKYTHGDHVVPMRMAFGGTTTVEYAPPMPISPIKEPVMTRTWLNRDGTTREMKPDEWVMKHTPEREPGVKDPRT